MYIFVFQIYKYYIMNNQEEQKILLNSNSFHRKDLTPEVRFKIASIALFFSHYGTKTKLSQKYNLSRTFVYNLTKVSEL